MFARAYVRHEPVYLTKPKTGRDGLGLSRLLLLFPVDLYLNGPGISVGMGWTIPGSSSGGDEIFRTCPDRPRSPPSLLHNGYRVLPGGRRRPWRNADPSPPSSAEVYKTEGTRGKATVV
jgi:hypothetical protein